MQLLPIQGTYKVLQEVEKLRSQLVLSQQEVEGLSIISISSCVACSSSNAEMAEECQHYWSVRLDCQQALLRGGLKSQDYHFGKTLKEEMKKTVNKVLQGLNKQEKISTSLVSLWKRFCE